MYEQENTQDTSGKRLLLVEDEALIAMATKHTLEKHGFAVTTVNTGEKAVDAVASSTGIDLILSDIDLGAGIDGTQAVERILERSDIPIVFLTSHSEKDYVDRIKKITGYGYVLKNSGEFVLVESINMAFKLHEAYTELKKQKENLDSALVREEHAHEQLAEKSAELEQYFTSSLDMLCIATTDGEFVRLNPEWESVLGYAVSELEGRRFTDLVHEDDRERTVAALSRLREQVELLSFENRYRCKDGSYRWIEWRARPIGSTIYAAARDVTERRKMEDALRESETAVRKKLKAVLEPDGDVGALALGDVIDVPAVQSLMERFHKLTDIPSGIVDNHGRVLVQVGWPEICNKFHRSHPQSLKNCIESDTILSQGGRPGTFKRYRCKNGMWDMSSPIVVSGRHLGNVFFGQFFHADEEPDLEQFREQARRYGFDETEYLSSIRRAPRYGRQTAERVMGFYSELAEMISSLSFSTLRLSRTLAERDEAGDQLRRAHQFTNTISAISSRFVKTTEESFDEDVNTMLARIGEQFGVDRAYLGLFSDNYETVTNTHEWCSEGVSSQMHRAQNLPTSSLSWLTSQFFSQGVLHIPDIAALPEEANSAKEELERQGIKSLLVVPVKCGDEVRGLVGFDAVAEHNRWSSQEIENLMTVASSLGHLLLRLRGEKMLSEAKTRAEESVTRFDELVRMIPVGVYVVWIRADGRMEFEYVSDRWCAIHKLCREDVLADAENANNQVHPDEREAFIERNRQAARDHEPFLWEGRFNVGDGEPRWLRIESTPSVFDHGDIRWFGVTQDITERKLTDEKLREREQLLESVVENAFEEMLILGLDGRVLFANQGCCRVWGVTPEEAKGVSIFDPVHPQDKDRIRDEFFSFVHGDEHVLQTRLRRVLPDGRTSWGDAVSVLLTDETGATERVLVITRDITEVKLREDQIADLLQQKQLLLTETHHRIKNHLNSVMSFLKLQAGDNRNEMVSKPILEAANRVHGLAQLYDKLYCAEGSGSVSARAYLGELVEKSIRLLDPRGDVMHSVEIDEDLILKANRLALVGIIATELITNSMKYAVGETESPRVALGLHAQDGHAVFTYRDNGSGLPETVHVESAETFGFQLIRMLVSQLDGVLSLRSDDGVEFRIEFPCC